MRKRARKKSQIKVNQRTKYILREAMDVFNHFPSCSYVYGSKTTNTSNLAGEIHKELIRLQGGG